MVAVSDPEEGLFSAFLKDGYENMIKIPGECLKALDSSFISKAPQRSPPSHPEGVHSSIRGLALLECVAVGAPAEKGGMMILSLPDVKVLSL